MAKVQQQTVVKALVAKNGIWTGKERIEAGTPLPDYLTEEQKQRLVKVGAAVEPPKGE